MHLIYCYISEIIPEYIYLSLKQARLFNPTISIYFITNGKITSKYETLNINIIKTKDLIKTKNHNEFIKKNVMKKTGVINFYNKNFWTLSTERFFYIEELMKKYNLINVIQIECDNLLYYDFTKIFNGIEKLNKKHIVCGDRPNTLSNAITYFKNYETISLFTNFLTKESQGTYEKILDKFNKYGLLGRSHAKVNDMSFTMLYYKLNKNNSDFMDLFPLLPFNENFKNNEQNTDNYKYFEVIFDGASWGMYLGGWPDEMSKDNKILGPGYTDKNYAVGRMLISKRFEFKWEENDKGYKIPICYDKKMNKKTLICNLHIHNKKVKDFISF